MGRPRQPRVDVVKECSCGKMVRYFQKKAYEVPRKYELNGKPHAPNCPDSGNFKSERFRRPTPLPTEKANALVEGALDSMERERGFA